MVSTCENLTSVPRTVTILGSTGSIGCSTIDLIEREAENYQVVALTANTNVQLLADQSRRLNAKVAVIADESRYCELVDRLAGSDVEPAAGPEALVEAAQRPAEWLMAAIVGAAGLAPTLSAVRRGAIVALANKECLVCAGSLFMDEVAAANSILIPVDSEHNAIFQVFDFDASETVEKIILTASGGPFRTTPLARLAHVTPNEAIAHPNWEMGKKISVDSATMMNKGLELIEAFHLFGIPQDRIEVIIHPQSIVHSMVAYVDGSVLAQLGTPDMRTPISYSLAWPRRMAWPSERLDLAQVATLSFEKPDLLRFPALALARQALVAGGAAPLVLNAANEVAVGGYLDGQIGFLEISRIVEETLERLPGLPHSSLEDVQAGDRQARRQARELIEIARVNA